MHISESVLNVFFSCSHFVQVQSIKQNNGIMKQSLTEGVDSFRPAEVSSSVFSFSLLGLSSVPSLILSCLRLFTSPLFFSSPPSDMISSPFGAKISFNLLFALRPTFSPLSPSLSLSLSPSQPGSKLNSRWTTEEQLLTVQGEKKMKRLLGTIPEFPPQKTARVGRSVDAQRRRCRRREQKRISS